MAIAVAAAKRRAGGVASFDDVIQFSRSFDMMRVLSVLVPVSMLMSTGCQDAAGDDAWLDDTRLHLDVNDTEARDDGELSTDWAEISPGIWERRRADGRLDRMGFGIEGIQFALERARRERVELLERADNWSSSGLRERLRLNQGLIEYLQGNLDEARKSGLRQELPLEPPTADNVTDSSFSPSSGVSGGACGGYYGLDVSFGYAMVSGWVDTTANWTEFGPFAPYQKSLYAYAYAWHEAYGEIFDDWQEVPYGPFSGQCCVGIQASAAAGPTFAPMMYGSAYVSVTNGCFAFEFYESYS